MMTMKQFFFIAFCILLVSATTNGQTRKKTYVKKSIKSAVSKNAVDDYNRALRLRKGGKFVDAAFTITKPLNFLSLPAGQQAPMNISTCKVSLEVIPFGREGNTIILNLDIPEIREAGMEHIYYSWSGKDVHLYPSIEQGSQTLTILRGSKPQCYLIRMDSKGKDTWATGIAAIDGAINYDIHKGMTKTELEDQCSELGLSRLKETGSIGNLTVYTLYWIDMQKRYDFLGDYSYEVGNNKEYGRFYFDAQGKLAKWILHM